MKCNQMNILNFSIHNFLQTFLIPAIAEFDMVMLHLGESYLPQYLLLTNWEQKFKLFVINTVEYLSQSSKYFNCQFPHFVSVSVP